MANGAPLSVQIKDVLPGPPFNTGGVSPSQRVRLFPRFRAGRGLTLMVTVLATSHAGVPPFTLTR